MDDDLAARLEAACGNLQRRAQELSGTAEHRDTALIMTGLAVIMEGIRSLGATAGRLDGPDGLGRSGETTAVA